VEFDWIGNCLEIRAFDVDEAIRRALRLVVSDNLVRGSAPVPTTHHQWSNRSRQKLIGLSPKGLV